MDFCIIILSSTPHMINREDKPGGGKGTYSATGHSGFRWMPQYSESENSNNPEFAGLKSSDHSLHQLWTSPPEAQL